MEMSTLGTSFFLARSERGQLACPASRPSSSKDDGVSSVVEIYVTIRLGKHAPTQHVFILSTHSDVETCAELHFAASSTTDADPSPKLYETLILND